MGKPPTVLSLILDSIISRIIRIDLFDGIRNFFVIFNYDESESVKKFFENDTISYRVLEFFQRAYTLVSLIIVSRFYQRDKIDASKV